MDYFKIQIYEAFNTTINLSNIFFTGTFLSFDVEFTDMTFVCD